MILPLFISAQDFDESFLKSLPEGVKTDLLKQVDQKNDLEAVQYKRPSTFMLKPENKSERFGSQIFTLMQTTLMPINEPNLDGDYILDFGDILELQIIGQKSSTILMNIKRDGSVNVPDIGKVFLSGLSLQSATDVIKNKVESSSIGITAFLTLTNVRDIQVIVAGNVFNPGPYTLNGNSNIFHALSVSGGPSEIGSFRKIQLIRDSEIIEEIDLYDLFINGKSSFGSRLRSGDIVFVKSVAKLITISGAVKRPGKYELINDESLSISIDFANGLTSYADLSDIVLYRLDQGNIKSIDINSIAMLKNIKASDGDRLNISKFMIRLVNVEGSVKNPGSYFINEGDGIAAVIKKAGGYTKNAYPFGGILENEASRKINQAAKEKLYNSFINELAKSSQIAQSSMEMNQAAIMQQLKDIKPSGRITAEFDLEILKANENLDIALQNGDSISIPEYLDQVYIYGEVLNEGAVRFNKKNDVMDYIYQVGGVNNSADNKNIFILYPNGTTAKYSTNKNKFLKQKNQIEIYSGSVIFVPREIKTLTPSTIQAYAAILGNIGISLASVSVLKD